MNSRKLSVQISVQLTDNRTTVHLTDKTFVQLTDNRTTVRTFNRQDFCTRKQDSVQSTQVQDYYSGEHHNED